MEKQKNGIGRRKAAVTRVFLSKGEGSITVSMQFMADVQLPCNHCKAKRYKTETLEILYREKSISNLLELTLQEALDFFSTDPDKLAQKVAEKIQPLVDVGLGYLTVGQSSSTMSGGEAQRHPPICQYWSRSSNC